MPRLVITFKENGTKTYQVDGRPSTKEEVDRLFPSKIEGVVKSGKVPVCRMPDMGWEQENDGRGRYITQLADGIGDQKAYCRSRTEAMEKAKRAGWTVRDAVND